MSTRPFFRQLLTVLCAIGFLIALMAALALPRGTGDEAVISDVLGLPENKVAAQPGSPMTAQEAISATLDWSGATSPVLESVAVTMTLGQFINLGRQNPLTIPSSPKYQDDVWVVAIRLDDPDLDDIAPARTGITNSDMDGIWMAWRYVDSEPIRFGGLSGVSHIGYTYALIAAGP